MTVQIRKFADDFHQLVEGQAEAPALVVQKELNPIIITYEKLDELIDRCCGLFADMELTAGDTIFSLMPNAAETLVLFLASIKSGCGFAPLPCTSSRAEIDRWIELVKPKVCFTTHLIYGDAEKAIVDNDLKTYFVEVDTAFSWLPENREVATIAGPSRVYLTTSGTSGTPKAIVLDGNLLWSSGRAFMEYHNPQMTPIRMWSYLPMSYLGGLFNMGLIPLSVGGSIVIGEPFSGKTFLGFWQNVERFDIDTLWFVPTIIRGLLKLSARAETADLQKWGKKIKWAFLGTAPIDLATKERFEQLFKVTLLENFALSETTFFTSETQQNIISRTESSVGEELPYTEIKLAPVTDEEGFETQFEICVKSPYLFLGYLGAEGEITRPETSDGYFPTGDLGHFDGERLLIIDGRKRDIIKAGGYLVALREIEVLVEKHAVVQEAAAVGIPHDFYGESYILYLILKNEAGENWKTEITKFVHQNIVQYKWPDKIEAVTEFPRTASGKIKKHDIRAEKEEA